MYNFNIPVLDDSITVLLFPLPDFVLALSNFPVNSLYPHVLPLSARRTQRHQNTQTGIGKFLNSVPSAIAALINHEFLDRAFVLLLAP